MKKHLLLFCMFAATCVQAQRMGAEIGLTYNYSDPLGSMAYNIAHANGISTNFGMLALDNRLAFGVDLGYSWYGREQTRQEYQMEDGSTAPMDIIVNNGFATFTIYGRWYLSTNGAIKPYVTSKLGYASFVTNLNIYDPDDMDHCEPVDTEQLYRDGTFVASAGAGVKFDLSKIFGKLTEDRLHFEASYHLTQGGQVSYMNANENGSQQHHHQADNNSDDVTAEFVNTQSQVVHKHHIGYLYNSPLQMSELKFGLSMRFME